MRLIHTHLTLPEDLENQQEREDVYNGPRCCITAEILMCSFHSLTLIQDLHTLSQGLAGTVSECSCGAYSGSGSKQDVIDEYYDVIDQLEGSARTDRLDGVGCFLQLALQYRSAKALLRPPWYPHHPQARSPYL